MRRFALTSALLCLTLAVGVVSCRVRLRNRDAQLDEVLRTSSDCGRLSKAVFVGYETGYAWLSDDEAAMHIAKQLELNPFVVAVESHGASDFAMRCQTDSMPCWFFFNHRYTLVALWPFHDLP